MCCEPCRALWSARTPALLAVFVFAVALLASLASCTSGETRGRRGRYATLESVTQLAVDQPCEYLGTVHKLSREVIERLRAREQITLEEWKCMAAVIVDVNYEVGIECHHRKVEFAEWAAIQEERYRGCLGDERGELARCAVIQVDRSGTASYCD